MPMMKEKKTLTNCDPRLRWVMDRVLGYYQLDDETLAVNMLQRHDGRAKKRLFRLFAGLENCPRVFYVYHTTYTKTFYKEVTLRKEVPRPKETSPTTSDREDNSDETAEEEKKKKKEPKKKKKVKKKPSKGDAEDTDKEEKTPGGEEEIPKPSEDANDDDNPPEDESEQQEAHGTTEQDSDTKDEPDTKKTKKSKKGGKAKKRPKSPASVVETFPSEQASPPEETGTMTIKMKRIIKKEKSLSQLHMRFGPLPWSNVRSEVTYVYFLLRNTFLVPLYQTYKEAASEMPKLFYIGDIRMPILEVFLKQVQIFHLYCSSFLSDPFDVVSSQTEGLEKFVVHRRKSKENCPSTEEYRTADSFERRLTSILRALKLEGDVVPHLKTSQLRNPEERIAIMSRVVPFPSVVNMDPMCVAIQDRPDLIELVTKLKIAIPRDIKNCPGSVSPLHMGQLKRILLASIDDLISLMSRSIKCTTNTSDVSSLPELAHLTYDKVKFLTKNELYVQHLEKTVQTWTKYMDNTLKKYKSATPEGKGPLPLYEYWAVRHEQLSLFMEECYHPVIQNILEVLKSAKSPSVQDFGAVRNALGAYYSLCSDNVEYLKITLTELKVLSKSKQLKEVTKVVSDIVDSLRVMWVLSNYWGSEQNFVELLSRIRWVICLKVTQILNVPQLFKLGNEEARVICQDAIDLMEVWKNSYTKTRSIIEKTRCEQRWEFERDLLFQETEYISHVARSLLEIVNVVRNYEDIFCRQFINTVKDGSKIDSIVYKVKDLTIPLVTADFNVFDREYAENWKILLECFWSDMKTVENEAIRVIRHSFANLRSAIKGGELLNDLRMGVTSEKLNKLLLIQYEAVSFQFSQEVKRIMDDFLRDRENPPLLRHHETFSGCVYWSRTLYSAVRDVLLVLLDVPEVLKTRRYNEALDDYSGFVDMICFYEKSIFVQMLRKYMPMVPTVFEKCIIKIVRREEPKEKDEYQEHWEWIAKEKNTKRISSKQRKSGNDSKRKNEKPSKKLMRRTIAEDLRGVSGSSTLSDSTCSSAMNSDQSSANESDVLSIVSQDLDIPVEELLCPEDVEVLETCHSTMAHTPSQVKISKKTTKIAKKKEQSDIRSSIVDIKGFPLGDGVYKSLSEILVETDGIMRHSKIRSSEQRVTLSTFNNVYSLISSRSTTPETDDTIGSDRTETQGLSPDIYKADKTPQTTSNDLLPPSWPASSRETLSDQKNRVNKGDTNDHSSRKYSNLHLKSLIQLTRTRQAELPSRPKKYQTVQYHTSSRRPSASPKIRQRLSRKRSEYGKSGTSDGTIGDDEVSDDQSPVKPGQRRLSDAPDHTKDTNRSNSGDSGEKSCDTDSSYTAQQTRRKNLLKKFSTRYQDRESEIAAYVEDSESMSTDSELTDDSNRLDKVECDGKGSPDGEVVGVVEADTPSPEVAVVVARDIYNGIPKGVPGQVPKFVDSILAPSRVSHPSSFTPPKLAEETHSPERSGGTKTRKRFWRRRNRPLTYWQGGDTDSWSSESSCTSPADTLRQKSRYDNLKYRQEDYRTNKFVQENLGQIMEIEDWYDLSKKSKKKDKKTSHSKEKCPPTSASPTKSARSLESTKATQRSKPTKCPNEIPKIYCGCRHDVKRYSWNEFMGTDILIEHGYTIKINYSESYECALHEIELFEELGYEIPEDLKQITTIKNSLRSDIQFAEKMIRRYASILENMKPTQIAALKIYICQIEKTLYFGLTKYTWSSLNIPEFCQSVMAHLSNLEFLVNQLHHMEECVESIVSRIIEIDSFQYPTSDVYSFQIFFKYCDYRREETLKAITQLYRKVPLIMYKMESLLFSEMTGCSEYLLLYYDWAENLIFKGLISFVVRNLHKYEDFLLGTAQNQFRIEACFEDNATVLRPELVTVANELASQAEKIIGMLSILVRWQEGTCHFSPQLKSSNSGSIHRFSFVEDLIQCCEVKTALDHIYETVSLVTEEIDQYLERWKKYAHLWKFDDGKTMRKFLNEQPTLAEYDECFSCYQSTIEELRNSKAAAIVHCVRIRVKRMSQKMLDMCFKWKSIMGDQLLASSRDHGTTMRTIILGFHGQLAQPITSLDTFQSVLQTINDCSSYQVEAELSLKEIHERHHLLQMWEVQIPDEDKKMAQDIENIWHETKRIAAYRSHLLAPTMKLFVTKATEVCDSFSKTSLVFGKKFISDGPGTYVHDLDQGLRKLEEYKIEFDEMEAKRMKMVQAEKLFDLQPMNFDIFCNAHLTLKHELLVFDIYERQKEEKQTWSLQLWNSFNPHKLLVGIDTYLDEFARLPEQCKNMPIARAIEKHMEDFKKSIPLMVDLQNKALRQRHWDELMHKTKHEFTMDIHTKMEHLFSMNLYEHYTLVEEIIANAEREAVIEAKLYCISERWMDEELPITQQYKSNGDDDVHYTLGQIDEIIVMLEQSVNDLLAMNQSKFSTPFTAPIIDWSLNLSEVLDVLKLWEKVQADWSNLDHVFDVGNETLESDAAFFKTVDAAYLELTRKSKTRPNIFWQCLQQNKKSDLLKIAVDLEVCQRNLRLYLGLRREASPRLYFLTDEEILTVFGSPNKIPPPNILSKMFVGVECLEVDHPDSSEISSDVNNVGPVNVIGIISLEGEILPFRNPISSYSTKDSFMERVLTEMKLSLFGLTQEAMNDLPNLRHCRKEWASRHLGSAVLTSSQVWFCSTVENAFAQFKEGSQRAMRKLLIKLNKELEEDMRVIRGKLGNNERKKLTTLLVQDAHSREVIEKFIAFNVISEDEFEWTSQLRFYWSNETNSLLIKQFEGSFQYGFEYMGLVTRQVITPLTERVRMTITQALTMQQGTNVQGPTATGKKETIKDLAVTLGTMCFVVNCGRLLTYSNFISMLYTISSCGIWVCFDKFDRLELSTLSFISTAVFALRQALVAAADYFYCEGRRLTLQPTANIFITMNPGCRGRQSLPQSINTLFRPVVCMRPDTEQICIITLISEGFTEAKVLSKKMTCLYKLAKTQLTHAKHYDFGLKVVKSVLSVAGSLKRNYPTVPEKVLLMRALRDVFTPKLLNEDVSFFRGLLKDVFPIKEPIDETNSELENEIVECLERAGLIQTPNQVGKVGQLHTILGMWHSVIIVGPTSGGKSTIIDTYLNVRIEMGQPARKLVLNANVYSLSELYGHYCSTSMDWNEGIIPHIFKTSNAYSENVFIVFDGSMDSDWVENMSSVMDDNRTLTLMNGERIRLGNRCSLLFETGHLENCSPATVSRTGLVYVDASDLGYEPYWKRWVKTRMDPGEADILQQLFEQFVPSSIQMITSDRIKTEVPLTHLNLVTQLCVLLEAQLPIIEPEYRSDVEERIKPSPTRKQELTCVFVQALYLSIGAVLTEESKILFDAIIKEISGMPLMAGDKGPAVSCGELPNGEPTLFDYKFTVEDKQWMPWSTFIAPYHHEKSQRTYEILVPNAELTKMLWLLELLVKFKYRMETRPKVKRPILVMGPSGSTKTSIINQYLKTLNREQYDRLVVHLPPRSSSMKLQNLIEQRLTRTMSAIYEPKNNRKLLVFIDDLDMALNGTDGNEPKETYEFLKFIIERHALYGRGKDKTMVHVNHIHFIGAMVKEAADERRIDPRFLSLFITFKMSTATSHSIKKIYGSILKGHTETFGEEIKRIIEPMIDMTLTLYDMAKKTFLPSPFKFHYIYNVRDLTQIFTGLLTTQRELYTEKCHFLRAWRNEFVRVICDRLMSEEDQITMSSQIKDVMSAQFPECLRYVMREPLLFGDFRNAMIKTEPRKYEDLLDYEAVYHLFTEIAVSYNKDLGHMNLILFEDALEHLTRIHRSLRQTRGHVLLLGAPNTGKRSLTKLASYTAVCEISILTLRRYHSYEFFRDTLSKLIQKLGTNGQPTTLLLASEHAMPEESLEMLNEIITNGSVSTVLTESQQSACVQRAKEVLQGDKIIDENKIFEYFTESCMNNLHIVLSISPVHSEFKKRCSLYSGIIRNSYIDWIFPWPKKALQAIAQKLLKDVDILPENTKHSIIHSCVHVHNSTVTYLEEYRRVEGIKCYLSPSHFLSFIEDYLRTIRGALRTFDEKNEELTRGQEKLEKSSLLLSELNHTLADQKKLINDKIFEIDELSEKILEAEETLNVKSAESKETALQAATLRKMMFKQDAEIEELMNKANPQLYSGRRALSELDQDSVSSMCASTAIPEPVQVVCECVAILRGCKKFDWPTVREYVEDPFFQTKMREMDYTTVSDETQQKIRTRMRSSRRIGEMEQISAVGLNLLKYLEAILNYCNIYKDIKPMQKRAKELEKQWHKFTGDSDAINEEIGILERELEDMKRNLKRTSAYQSKMKDETSKMDMELEAANSLFSELEDDSTRWKRELRRIQYEAGNVYGDCLLSAAFLNYASVFDHKRRQRIIFADWKFTLASKHIQTTSYYTIESHLSDDLSINRWLAENIPRDTHAVQNAILMKRSSNYPICVDPDQQMLKWISNHEQANNLSRVSTNDPAYVQNIVAALTVGRPIVLCEIEFLDSVLEEILNNQVRIQETGAIPTYIVINGENVQVHLNFRLYIIISTFEGCLDPSVFAIANIINCSMKEEAIEDKCAEMVAVCDHPDMDEERKELFRSRCALRIDWTNLQEQILHQISKYDKDMFDDFPFIQNLKDIKCRANIVLEQMERQAQRIDELSTQRQSYSSLASRCAEMFLAFNCMRKVDPLSTTSFQTFERVLEKLLRAINGREMSQKLEIVTLRLFDYQSLGLLSRNKRLYAFHLAINSEIRRKRLTESLLHHFLSGDSGTQENESPFSWLTAKQWGTVEDLARRFPASFESFPEDIKRNDVEWREWFTSGSALQLPLTYENQIGAKFEKLILIKEFRFDALYECIMSFVKNVLGEAFLTPSVVRLEGVFPLTTAETPVVIRVCPGTDQLNALLNLSSKHNPTNGNVHLAMGAGAEENVYQMMKDCMQDGRWLIVQNCHLLPSFMFRLYTLFNDQERKHEDFRLWLTTETVSVFQKHFVHISHKVVFEVVSPLKLNLLDTYNSLDLDQLSTCEHPAFGSTVFALAFFHAVIEERKKFGKYGWNMVYEFTKSDLKVSIRIIKQYLNKIFYKGNCKIPWASLRYFIGEVVYGGRVMNDFDRRILMTYVNEFFGDFILESTKPFKFNRNGKFCQYPLPLVGEKQEYFEYIHGLPLMTEPSVFGMHENRQRDVDVSLARELWHKLSSIAVNNPGTEEQSCKDAQQRNILELTDTILSCIPEKFQFKNLKSSLGPNPKPTTLYLLRELETFNRLIHLMKTTMEDVRKAVTGLRIMTDYTNELTRCLLSHSPPTVWRQFSPQPTRNIGQWLSHFGMRHEQFSKWVSRGEPWIVWLSGLTYPEAYLTAISQVACREEGWQIDSVAINTEVTTYERRNEIPSKPKTGAYVEGLYLDGASWDREHKCLASSPTNLKLDSLPIIGFFPALVRGLAIQGNITLPMYTTTKRNKRVEGDAVADINIPTKKHESFWILENICVVMNCD